MNRDVTLGNRARTLEAWSIPRDAIAPRPVARERFDAREGAARPARPREAGARFVAHAKSASDARMHEPVRAKTARARRAEVSRARAGTHRCTSPTRSSRS